MVVETLVSPNATRSQQCTQMPQTNVERSFSPICVHSYCVFPCGRARRPRPAGPGATPPPAWRGVARAHLPSWPIFHSAPQAGGRLRPTPPGQRRDGKAQSARRGSRRLRLSVRCRAKLCPSARPRAAPAPSPAGRAWQPSRARRRARAAAHGSSQLGAGPRGRRRLGSASSGLKKHWKVRLTGSDRRMRYTSLLRCVSCEAIQRRVTGISRAWQRTAESVSPDRQD